MPGEVGHTLRARCGKAVDPGSTNYRSNTVFVKDLIAKLEEYNPEAEVQAMAHNHHEPFSLSYGYSDGITKETCEKVFIDVDALNQYEEG
jgi:hypothetical protein